ncbi:LOW QUALITY PROTEIN: sperm acrosome membrane-associated protein 4-like [Salminus brasiliensis]|uniref:LOW QUALITY PROTEIN: sperm acrosome membrane-associated protein 4-like n=1 Tax=Salminus brasiliensis TaxID=930266 RepID=UPI003B832638
MSGITAALVLGLLVAVSCSGQTLECFRCDLGFWDVCYTTKTNCSDEEQCFVGIGKAASVLDIKVMGCLPVRDCNKTTALEFPSNKTLYTMTKNCCDESYCNGSPGALMASFTLIVLTAAHTVAQTGAC